MIIDDLVFIVVCNFGFYIEMCYIFVVIVIVFYVLIFCDYFGVFLVGDGIKNRLVWKLWRKFVLI